MIRNDFVALGPNVTGYPGGYPNGYLEWVKRRHYWGSRRLHLCAGSVEDPGAVRIDLNRDVWPTIRADLSRGIPLADGVFNTVLVDPPYAESKAQDLYGVPLLSVPKLLKEAARVLRPNGLCVLLDLRVWVPPEELDWVELSACYVANRGPKPLRAIQVFRKKQAALETFTTKADPSGGTKGGG